MSEHNYLPSPGDNTPARPRTSPAWIALPLGVASILVSGIVALIVVLVGAIVTTVVTILLILLFIPVLLIGLILGLIEDLRGGKTPFQKGSQKPPNNPYKINGRIKRSGRLKNVCYWVAATALAATMVTRFNSPVSQVSDGEALYPPCPLYGCSQENSSTSPLYMAVFCWRPPLFVWTC